MAFKSREIATPTKDNTLRGERQRSPHWKEPYSIQPDIR